MATGGFISGIIGIVISVIMVTEIVVPTIKNANTTGWSTAEIAMLTVASLVAVAGLVYGIIAVFGLG